MKKSKRGLALIVSYVILIGIALALSALVYTWMKSKVQKPFAEESCPEDISLVLVSAKCPVENYSNSIKINVQNRGLFNIHGYIIKSNDEETGIAGKSSFNLYVYGGNPGDNIIDFTTQEDNALTGNEKNLTLFEHDTPIKQIEIEPFIIKNGTRKYCEKAVITHKLNC